MWKSTIKRYHARKFSVNPHNKNILNLLLQIHDFLLFGDVEARKLVSEAHEKTEALLKEHHKDLEKMAQALLEKETLNYDDVESLIGPPKYGNIPT